MIDRGNGRGGGCHGDCGHATGRARQLPLHVGGPHRDPGLHPWARAWFEAAIGCHLDLGRPERVSLVVNRKFTNRSKNKTPGRFATEVITRDVAHGLRIAASFTHERELDHLLHTTRLAA